jgi:phospholipase/carboxylesterase
MKEIINENFIGHIPDGETAAILAMLHGYGANERDMDALAPRYMAAIPGLAYFSLRAPYESERPELAAAGGRQWFSFDKFRPLEEAILMPETFEKETMINFTYIGEIISQIAGICGIAPEKTIMAGFSQGGGQAVAHTLYSGNKLLGAISFSGVASFGKWEIKNMVPILCIHGTEDEVVPFAFFEQARASIKAANVPAEYKVIKGLGHAIDEECVAASVKFINKLIPAE